MWQTYISVVHLAVGVIEIGAGSLWWLAVVEQRNAVAFPRSLSLVRRSPSWYAQWGSSAAAGSATLANLNLNNLFRYPCRNRRKKYMNTIKLCGRFCFSLPDFVGGKNDRRFLAHPFDHLQHPRVAIDLRWNIAGEAKAFILGGVLIVELKRGIVSVLSRPPKINYFIIRKTQLAIDAQLTIALAHAAIPQTCERVHAADLSPGDQQVSRRGVSASIGQDDAGRYCLAVVEKARRLRSVNDAVYEQICAQRSPAEVLIVLVDLLAFVQQQLAGRKFSYHVHLSLYFARQCRIDACLEYSE